MPPHLPSVGLRVTSLAGSIQYALAQLSPALCTTRINSWFFAIQYIRQRPANCVTEP